MEAGPVLISHTGAPVSDEPEGGELGRMAAALARWGGTAGGVALTTAVLRAAGPRWHLANLSILYLVLILPIATLAGRGPAILAALLSFMALDWYFVPPVGHWAVSDPDEWLTLITFLIAGLVTGQMAAGLRARAAEAQAREWEMATLYELSTATAGHVEPETVLAFLAARIQERFGGAPCEFLLWDRDDQLRPLDLPSVPAGGPMSEFALRSGPRDFGRMRVGRRADGWPHAASDRRLLGAVARHAALAIERGRLGREAREARLLKDSDALKSTLLSAVSHDLRTPLAGIKALATTLLSEGSEHRGWRALPPDVVQEALRGIDEETDRMARLISDLLDLSRIEAGVLRPCRGPVLIPELIEDTLHRLAATVAGREVRCELEEPPAIIDVDYVQLQQVLTNLLENAARYSPAGSPITIGSTVRDDCVALWVADRGPGVPADRRERVFDRFYRLEHHETEPHGTGLGLAICRGLVEAHGGRIRVGETPGGGATFRIELPVQPVES